MRMPGRTAGRLRRNGPIQPSPRRRSCADPGRALRHSNRAPPRVDHAIAPGGSVADARRPYDFWVAVAIVRSDRRPVTISTRRRLLALRATNGAE